MNCVTVHEEVKGFTFLTTRKKSRLNVENVPSALRDNTYGYAP